MLNVTWSVCFCLRWEWSPLTFHWGWVNNSSKWRWNPLWSEVGDHPRVSRAEVDVPSPIETAKAFTELILKCVGWRIFHVISVSYPVLWPKLKSSTHTLRAQELLDVCFREDTGHTWYVKTRITSRGQLLALNIHDCWGKSCAHNIFSCASCFFLPHTF